ncbi:Bug family tripartite tricarboxylate transporter substrate binding protein [Rhodoplanes sp. Z2-YC6860]|uniref:Bug family tripartite tricarboxylate transporter substrate binding protein n=1 Tax=Rhodoplanes sp. Z2-YC6860 TaxID=674703 RepID=UPI00078E34C8|nr:tripartite tricarboxylate transporter substrate binding protein [Rhodoplanes sp. Z2-YC6860]AMN41675.1 extra-cytoplasmic solute receptor [Rhodoplanes sp. Z2-YC6860]
MKLGWLTRLALLGSILVTASDMALAQQNTIRFIIGTAPGGAIDPYARIVADPMAKALNQSIIVEYKPGANGNSSAQFIVDQPADGQHVWVGTQAFTEINPSAFTNQRWSIDDFVPFIRGVEAPLVFAVHPDVPAKTFAEFLTWAKQNKGKLSYSSYQPGTPSHFLGYQLNEKFDLDLTHVPYRGSGLQATALLAGHSQFGFAQLNSTAPHQATGKLRILAVTGRTRDKLIPDVPTFEELGYPEFTAKVWFGLLVKKGTPADIISRYTEAAKVAHADPGVREKLQAQGFDVVAETGPQLLPNIKEQIVRWGKLVKASGFSAEDRGSTR